MDTGDGRLRQFAMSGLKAQEEIDRLLDEHPNAGGLFAVGDIVWIRGSRFKIKSIKPREVRLRLLARGQSGDRCVCPSCGQSHDPGGAQHRESKPFVRKGTP